MVYTFRVTVVLYHGASPRPGHSDDLDDHVVEPDLGIRCVLSYPGRGDWSVVVFTFWVVLFWALFLGMCFVATIPFFFNDHDETNFLMF